MYFTWNMALMHTIIPNAVNNHHNQVLSDPEAKSVECLTIKVHLAKERPNPAKAPYLQEIFFLIFWDNGDWGVNEKF